jgi:hypothetical protein
MFSKFLLLSQNVGKSQSLPPSVALDTILAWDLDIWWDMSFQVWVREIRLFPFPMFAMHCFVKRIKFPYDQTAPPHEIKLNFSITLLSSTI